MTELVDPTACARRSHALAERPVPYAGASSVLLVDATLNRSSRWGAGMLDAAESVLDGVGVRLARDQLNPLDVRPGELWVEPIVERHDGIVLAAGDCLTCTSRAARNLVIAERAGLPGVLICTGGAEDTARAVATGLGMPDLHVLPVQESLFGRNRTEIAEIVRPVVRDNLVDALLASTISRSTEEGP